MKATPRFDFGRFVTWLGERDIRYLLIGGHAVRAYGSPRFTHDYDFWFDHTSRQAVLEHLRDTWDMELSADPEDRRRPVVVCVSDLDKVDCFFARGMSTPDGVHADFDTFFDRSVLMAGPTPPAVRVPAPEDLIVLKQLRRNPKPHDLEDIEFLRVCHSVDPPEGEAGG